MKDSVSQSVAHSTTLLTLGEAQDLFLQELVRQGFAPKTQRNYQIDVGQLCAFLQASCGVATAQRVELAHLERYLRHLTEQGLTPATCRRKVAAIRAFCRFLQKDGHRPDNPAEHLRPPERDRRHLRYLTETEYRRLLDVARRDVRATAII